VKPAIRESRLVMVQLEPRAEMNKRYGSIKEKKRNQGRTHKQKTKNKKQKQASGCK